MGRTERMLIKKGRKVRRTDGMLKEGRNMGRTEGMLKEGRNMERTERMLKRKVERWEIQREC